MNRKERRAAVKRDKSLRLPASAGPRKNALGLDDLIATARQHYQQDRVAQAEDACRQVLASDPAQRDALNLLGLMSQASNRHDRAVVLFARALKSNAGDAVCHFNIASSYQALARRNKALAHFTRAIALGLDPHFILQCLARTPVIAACLARLAQAWPRRMTMGDLFGSAGVAAIADQVLLQCALKSIWICDREFENFLTHLRYVLLQLAAQRAPAVPSLDDMQVELFGALAQQCFINEYVFDQTEDETRQAIALRDLLNERLAAGGDIPALLLVAVAAYFPLHSLEMAQSLLQRGSGDPIGDLIRQQIREPLEERQDRQCISALTTIDDGVSLQVRQQYEENPFPRWIALPPVKLQPTQSPGGATEPNGDETRDILIAGCGTGQHAIDAALLFPRAHILAVDLSLASLAYARRKTREQGVTNVEYAQADILEMAALNRTFDRIEVGGVLHHLADPLAGWRVLLSLLRSGGVMEVGLYSELARRAIVAGRALIAQSGYPSTVQGIRACRREIFRAPNGSLIKSLDTLRDFYGTSGCRDLLFHVMEHRFTLPQIKALLADSGVSFLGFETHPEILEAFRRRFPDPAALTDLDLWHAFETDNPEAFIGMYRFVIRKNR